MCDADAGARGKRTHAPGTLQALQEKLAAAEVLIAKLQAELGAAKAKVDAEK